MRKVCGLWLIAAAGLAQQMGTFSATGSMGTARADHSATLLPSGKVLIAGGYERALPDMILASAELYDPTAGTFSPAGSMTTPRARHSAVLLPDGRVLIVGGSGDLSAEIYDPAAGTFTATESTATQTYFWNSAALLQDGRVFIAGQPTAQIFDPVSGKFSATAAYSMGPPDYLDAVTVLADGGVLVTGAYSQVYDPQNDRFTTAPGMNHPYDEYTVTLLIDGEVLLVGNADNDGTPADAEVYDPAKPGFTALPPAAYDHEYAAAAMLADGTVLVTGGQLPGGNGENVSELYAPAGGFSNAGNMTWPRHEHTATLLADGTVLIAGGYDYWPGSTANAEVYRPASPGAAPRLFPLAADGSGQGAIWHSQSGQPANAASPAVAGEALSLYTTGLASGGVVPPGVYIGGRPAPILYFGDAPGYPGFYQVNVRMPDGVGSGSAVPVRLTYFGRPSNAVTIAAQ